MRTQNPLVATPCGFKSHHRHHVRNGLCSIQKAQPVGRAFLIPLRHSSFSPQNFAAQTFAGAPPWAEEKSGYPFYHANSASETAWESHSQAVLFCNNTLITTFARMRDKG